MEQIKQLMSVSSYRPQRGPLSALYDFIEEERKKEDILLIFQESGRGKNYVNNLANRLRSKLLEGVLSFQFNDHAEYKQRSFEVYNLYAICMRLIRSANKIVGIPETEKTIQKAMELGMTAPALLLAVELENYMTTVRNKSKYYKYKSIADLLKKEQDLELRLFRIFSEIQNAVNWTLPCDEIEIKLEEISHEMPGRYYRSNLYYYLACNKLYSHKDDKTAVIATCKQALNFYSNYKLPLPVIITWNFHKQMIPILISEKKFAEAEATAKSCVPQCIPGDRNWHTIHLFLALVGFHSGKPKIALNAWKKANSVPMKFKESEFIEEQWQLILCYLDLYNVKLPKKFKLYKFLNSIPTLEQDKSRNNVAVTIGHLLHLWKDGRKEKFGDITSKMPKYIHRYLRRKDASSKRSMWFLLILAKYYKSGFNPKRYLPRIKYLREKLESSTPEISVNVFETEVIPLERAWEMLTTKT